MNRGHRLSPHRRTSEPTPCDGRAITVVPGLPSLAARGTLGAAWVSVRPSDSDPNDPAATALVELRTADGVPLVTADGHYLGTVN